jgi:hypothetical protein
VIQLKIRNAFTYWQVNQTMVSWTESNFEELLSDNEGQYILIAVMERDVKDKHFRHWLATAQHPGVRTRAAKAVKG